MASPTSQQQQAQHAGLPKRMFRVGAYTVGALLLTHLTRIQFVGVPTLLKSVNAGSTMLQQRFGGAARFLTVQSLMFCVLYAYVGLAHALVDCFFPASRLHHFLERATHRPSVFVTTLAIFVCVGYYILIHPDPVMKGHFEEFGDEFVTYMHLLHAVPAVFVVVEVLFLKHVDLGAWSWNHWEVDQKQKKNPPKKQKTRQALNKNRTNKK
eukprot:m.36440 g.36440  ORF g.36440 m.36440 type:complete len:210 (+) comp11017_c0_seq3:67-696(+)